MEKVTVKRRRRLSLIDKASTKASGSYFLILE